MNQPTPPPAKPQGAQTPRTDAAAAWVGGNCAITVIDEMRKMEKQLTAATEALEKAKAELARAMKPSLFNATQDASEIQRLYRLAREDKDTLVGEVTLWRLRYEEVHMQADDLGKQFNDERDQSGKREAALREALVKIQETAANFIFPPVFFEIEDICKAALSQQATTNSTTGSTPQG
jgi:hypothetical protein